MSTKVPIALLVDDSCPADSRFSQPLGRCTSQLTPNSRWQTTFGDDSKRFSGPVLSSGRGLSNSGQVFDCSGSGREKGYHDQNCGLQSALDKTMVGYR